MTTPERLYARCLTGYARASEKRPLPPGWHPKTVNPPKPGVYQTSHEMIVHYGGARGYWNGRSWESYQEWGDYSKMSSMVWAPEGTVYGRS